MIRGMPGSFRFRETGEPRPEPFNQVPAAVCLGGAFFGKDIPGIAVDPDAERGGVYRAVAAGQQAANQAGEDISAAALGHSGVAGCVDERITIWGVYPAAVSLDYHYAAGPGGQGADEGGFVIRCHIRNQPPQLSRVIILPLRGWG